MEKFSIIKKDDLDEDILALLNLQNTSTKELSIKEKRANAS